MAGASVQLTSYFHSLLTFGDNGGEGAWGSISTLTRRSEVDRTVRYVLASFPPSC